MTTSQTSLQTVGTTRHIQLTEFSSAWQPTFWSDAPNKWIDDYIVALNLLVVVIILLTFGHHFFEITIIFFLKRRIGGTFDRGSLGNGFKTRWAPRTPPLVGDVFLHN